MPVDLTVDAERRLVLVTGYDLVTGAELRAADDKLRGDSGAQPDFDELLDYSAVTEQSVTADDLFALSRKPPFFKSTSKRAVVGRSQLTYGNMRMFEILRDGSAGVWRYFDTREAAERWLKDEEPVPPRDAN